MSAVYVILVYDVNVKRVAKVLDIARRYLSWVQNSVLEGELTRAQLQRLRAELGDVIDQREDSVLFYVLRSTKGMQRIELGTPKADTGWIV